MCSLSCYITYQFKFEGFQFVHLLHGPGAVAGGRGVELLNSCLLMFCDCNISFETLAHIMGKDTWGIPPQRIYLEN